MTTNYSAGGPIDAWCSKCRLELGHTVVATVGNIPKRVKCNTCNGQHNFRAKGTVKKQGETKKTARKTKSRETNYEEYLSRLKGCKPSDAKKYSMQGNFEKDEVIDHPVFGMGIVLSVIQADKINILFKEGPKLLIQNQ